MGRAVLISLQNDTVLQAKQAFPLSGHSFGMPCRVCGPLLCRAEQGALAQLGERLICIQEVRSSILLGSTKPFAKQRALSRQCLRAAKVTGATSSRPIGINVNWPFPASFL